MIEILKLKPAEYEVLKQIEEGTCPDPHASIAIVAKDGERLVGRMLLIAPAHIEGTWIKEGWRKGTVGIRMMRRMEDEARKGGLTKVFAYSAQATVDDYLERMGYEKCPVSVWMKELV